MSFFDEGYAPPPVPEPEATERPYGEVVPFDVAFHPRTVVMLGLSIGRENFLWLGGIGMGVLVAAVMIPLELRIPLPESLEASFRSTGPGLVLGYVVHRTLSLDLSSLLSSVVGGAAIGAVSRLVRGEDHASHAFFDQKLLLSVLVYEIASLLLGLVAASPFVLVALLLPAAPALLLVALAVVTTLLVSVATRPGLWAMCVDDLNPRDALVGGLVGAARHPTTMLLLYGAYVLALVASVGAFAFLVIGVFQLGFAASWVAFGATEEELDALPLLDEVPR